MEHPALTHIEKTLGDAYRREIEQTENVWRSLPFFAATLALQLATVFQVAVRLPPVGSRAGQGALMLLVTTGVLMFAALSLLAACVAPAAFESIADDEQFLRYTERLVRAERAERARGDPDPLDAAEALKRELARQYAKAAKHNKRINQRHKLQRSLAGLAATTSVLTTLLLTAVVFGYALLGTG